METNLKNLILKRGYLLIEPQPDSTSSFSSEHKKYDRKSIGTIVNSSATEDYKVFYQVGERVVFSDNNSTSIQFNGATYEVVPESDILGIFKES